MNDVIDSDGFRANVGIVLMRGAGEVFLGRRVGGRGWQFPQGGVRSGEGLEEAVLREELDRAVARAVNADFSIRHDAKPVLESDLSSRVDPEEIGGKVTDRGDGKIKVETKTKTKVEHGDDKETHSKSEMKGDMAGAPFLGVKSMKMIAAACP